MKRLSLTTPHLLVMVGTPGAGKSFFARRFSETFAAPMVGHDDIRAIISAGQPNFGKEEQAIVSRLAEAQLDQLLLTKDTAIVDGGSDTRSERQNLAKKARAHGYKVLFVWVQTDPVTSRRRAVIASRSRPQHELMSAEQYEVALKRFTAPSATEPTIVISGKHTYATQARVILKKLSEPRVAAENRQAGERARPLVRRPVSRIRIT